MIYVTPSRVASLRQRGHAVGKWVIGLAAALTIGLLSACGSTEPSSVAGSYTLESVNGQPIPYTSVVGSVRTTITSGLFIVSPKGEWSRLTDGTQTVSGARTSTFPTLAQGTWTGSGSTLSFISSTAPFQFTATVSGGTLTYSDGGTVFVYRR